VTRDIEKLVRAAAERQADLAVDPERILRTLAERRRPPRHRARNLTIAAAAAAMAVAVAVPTMVIRGMDRGSQPVASATGDPSTTAPSSEPTTSPPPASPPVLATFTAEYRPTWLPPGLVERTRGWSFASENSIGGGLTRIWTAGPVELGRQVDRSLNASVEFAISPLNPTEPPQYGPSLREVDINGVTGRVSGQGSLIWQPDAQTLLTLIATPPLPEEDMLRIARSVQPDATRQRALLHLGWLPDGTSASFGTVNANGPNSWEAITVAHDHPDTPHAARRSVVAYVGTVARETGINGSSEQLTVGGRPARLVKPEAGTTDPLEYHIDWLLTVDLGGGRHLTVYYSQHTVDTPTQPLTTREDAIRVAESVVVDPYPDLAWTG